MSKEEFLRVLRLKISGAMAPSEVESQIDYYSAYIDGEIMKGKSQEQVIEELGDPTLIAKTLTSAIRRAEDEAEYQESNNNAYSNEQGDETSGKSKVVSMGGAGCIIAFIVVMAIIILLIVLMVKFSFAIIRILWPVIIVLLVGGLIFGILRRR